MVSLVINNYQGDCGITNVNLLFFNDDLICVYLSNLEEKKANACYLSKSAKYKGSKIKVNESNDFMQRKISICDSYLERKMLNWIYKWS